MDSIKNASSDTIDLIIASANPRPLKIGSAKPMINGNWFIQSIGNSAEQIDVNVICSWAVVQELIRYADTKEKLTIEYLDFEKSGPIMEQPEYELYSKGSAETRLYSVSFKLAVIPDV